MKRYIVEADNNGAFDIPGGSYGYSLKPTLRRINPGAAPNTPLFFSPVPPLFDGRNGILGQFPVVVRALVNGADGELVSNSETVYSAVPLPAYRVSECEPGSLWRVVLMETAQERFEPSARPYLAEADLGALPVPFYESGDVASTSAGIVLRLGYQSLMLWGQNSGDPAFDESIYLHVMDPWEDKWVWRTWVPAVDPILVIPGPLPVGRLYLTHAVSAGLTLGAYATAHIDVG